MTRLGSEPEDAGTFRAERSGRSFVDRPQSRPYALPVPTTGNPDNLQRVKDASGLLTSATLRRMESELEWYRGLSAQERSWVGLLAQSAITAFTQWFAAPDRPPHGANEIFAGAPPELARSISLQHTLQLVRIGVAAETGNAASVFARLIARRPIEFSGEVRIAGRDLTEITYRPHC